MSTPQQITHTESSISNGDHRLIRLIGYLIPTEVKGLGYFLLHILRFKWHNRPIRTGSSANNTTHMPTGPFITTRKHQLGDLLLWVPRDIEGYLIDRMSGGYGYSHVTVDTGENDQLTGKPVMVESTIGEKVIRRFQDEYRQRPFARVPILETGVNVEQFVICIKSKIGETYDILDALTLGEIEDPAKEICSRLAADCLPEEQRHQIGRAKKLGLVCRASVSVYPSQSEAKTREFISPNGFAEYYGAPKGRKLKRPNTTIQPKPTKITVKSMASMAGRHHAWKIWAGLAGIIMLLIFFWNLKISFWKIRKS